MQKQTKPHGRTGAARKIPWTMLIIAVLLALTFQPVLAQTLRYSVPEAKVDVYVNEDGTVSITYDYLFQNSPNGDAITIVDIGLPTNNYDLNSITATIDGEPATLIRESEYVKPGIEIHLGANSIQPGESGRLLVNIGKVERMLFKANTQEPEGYASFQFQPNFFPSESVSGKTNLTVTLHLPPGLNENEPRYFEPKNWPGANEPVSGYDDQGRVYYSWTTENADMSSIYVFGSAFPARLVPASVLLTETPAWVNSDALCPLLFCLGFVGFLALTIWTAVNGDKKRRMEYLPPKISVEGHGIKRGLTAVEAALVMQQPMDKILTMILFAVIKKGAATVVTRNPMKLDVADPLPDDMRDYEASFVKAMALEKPADQRRALQDMMTALVKSVSEKMRGFSRKETIAYYDDIMNKAWQQVEQAETPEMKMQMYDDAMDWTMLDRKFDDRTRDVFGPRPVILPVWWGRYDPTIGRSSIPSSSAGPSIPRAGNQVPQGVNLPNLPGSDFAASMVGGMQAFSSNVIGNVTSFTGGVTEKTNPVPKPPPSTRSGGGFGGGGGGRSCACACACAGCACACAGGGR